MRAIICSEQAVCYHSKQAMASTTNELGDEFLSEEDLALKDLTWEELLAWWNQCNPGPAARQRRARPLLPRGGSRTANVTANVRRLVPATENDHKY